MTQKINFYNHKDAETAALAIVRDIKNEDISKWYQTIATRWLRQQEECAVPVMPGTQDLPEWAQKDLEDGKTIHHFVISQDAKNKLLNIAHWLQILSRAIKKNKNEDLVKEAQKVFGNLPKTSVEVAHKKANDWYKKEARKSSKSLLKNSQNAEALEIIESQDDYIWERVSTNGMIAVGKDLLNCLRYGYYQTDVKQNLKNIWALRDPNGSYIAALTVDVQEKTIIECKGHNNEAAYGCGKHVFNLMEKLNLKNNADFDLNPIHILGDIYLPEAKPLDTLSNGQNIIWIEEKQENQPVYYYNDTEEKEIIYIYQLIIIKEENNNFKTETLIKITSFSKDVNIDNYIFNKSLKEEDYKKIFNHIIQKLEQKKIIKNVEKKSIKNTIINNTIVNNIEFFQFDQQKNKIVYWDEYSNDIIINNQNFKHIQTKISCYEKNQVVDQYYTCNKENIINLAVAILDNKEGYIQNNLDEIIEGNSIDFLKELDPEGKIFLPNNNLQTYSFSQENILKIEDYITIPEMMVAQKKWPWDIYPTGEGWSHIDQLTEVIDLEGFENYKIKIKKFKTKLYETSFSQKKEHDFNYSYDLINPDGKVVANILYIDVNKLYYEKLIHAQGNFEGNPKLASAFIKFIENEKIKKEAKKKYFNIPNFIFSKEKNYEPIKQTGTSIVINNGLIIKANRHWFGTRDGINMLWEMPSPRKKVVSSVKILTDNKKEAIKHLAEVSKEIGLTFTSNQQEFKETGYTLANGNLITRAMPHIENIDGIILTFKTGNETSQASMIWNRVTLTKNDLEWQLSTNAAEYNNQNYQHYYYYKAHVYVDTKGIAYFKFYDDIQSSRENQIKAINVFLKKTGLKPDIFTLLRLNCIFKNGQIEKPDETSILKNFKENQFFTGENIWHIDYTSIKLLNQNNEKLIHFNYSKNNIRNANFKKISFEEFLDKSKELNDFLNELKKTY